jgi:FHA domain
MVPPEATMHPTIGSVPHLVVLAPDNERGRRIDLNRDDLLVGRGDGCDVRFDDPFVSRTHARLQRHGQAVYLRDLGSSGGTFVNGAASSGARELRNGDIVRFAHVELRFTVGEECAAETRIAPGDAAAPVSPVNFDIGYQRDGVFHNVGRDQYIMQQRESFLRHVAATRTKARWLIWLGFACTAVGFAMFASGVLRFISSISDAVQSGTEPSRTVSPLGGDVGGFPSGLIGWALAAIGSFMIALGVVLHVVAASRRKRVDREYPAPFSR